MDILHKKERRQLISVVVALSVVIAIMAIVLGYFVWQDSTSSCPVCEQLVAQERAAPIVDVDSDEDGLTDVEEIGTYMTDPENPDTDGDGYLDGAEVKGGYDPLVPAAAN